MPHERATTTSYAAFLSELVKERDFMTFRPWQRGTEQSEIAWKHRVVLDASMRFQRPRAAVAEDLDRTLDARQKANARRYAARAPALAAEAWRRSRRLAIKWALLPMLRVRYVGLDALSPWHGRHERGGRGGRGERAGYAGGATPASVDSLAGLVTPRSGGVVPIASIVLLSYNRLAYLATTLAALQATTARDEYELVVVDNGSTDGSAEALRQLAAAGAIDKLVLEPMNRGTSGGFNAGFAAADPKTRYLIKVDSDIVLLTPGWLRAFDRFYERVPDLGLLAMTQLNHVAHRLAPTRLVAGERVISWNDSINGGACMTIPRPLFERLGYFREDFAFKYMPDDIDYAARVSLTGHRSFYLRRTVAYHRHDLDRHYAAIETGKREVHDERKARMARIRREYVAGQHGLYVPRAGVTASVTAIAGR